MKLFISILLLLAINLNCNGAKMEAIDVIYEISGAGSFELSINDITVYVHNSDTPSNGFGRINRFLLDKNKVSIKDLGKSSKNVEVTIYNKVDTENGIKKNILLTCNGLDCNKKTFPIKLPSNFNLNKMEIITNINKKDKDEIYELFINYLDLLKRKDFKELDKLTKLYEQDMKTLDPSSSSVKPSESMPEFFEFLSEKDFVFVNPKLDELIFSIALDNKAIYLSSKSIDAKNRKGAFRFTLPILSRQDNQWKIVRFK